MKKLLAIALSTVLVFSLAACGDSKKEDTDNKAAESTEAADNGAAAEDGAADKEAENNNKEFTVGFDAEYPPYGFLGDDGEYTGFDLELAQAVCDMEGWTLVKTPVDWDFKDKELDAGTIDCIWNGFTINGREDDYTWSDPYVNNEQVIVVSKDAGITTLADLAGKYVGVQAGSAALGLLEEGGDQGELGSSFAELQQFADYNTAFTELQTGTVDAVAMDVGVANYQIQSRGEGYVILDEKLNSEQYGIGFKKGNTELRDKVNDDIKKLAADGTVSTLAEKYDISDMICLEGVK